MTENAMTRKPRNLTYRIVYEMALNMFQEDKDRTNRWWMSPLRGFDERSPFQMVKDGEGRELIKAIMKCQI